MDRYDCRAESDDHATKALEGGKDNPVVHAIMAVYYELRYANGDDDAVGDDGDDGAKAGRRRASGRSASSPIDLPK
jgi:hypothetical protein